MHLSIVFKYSTYKPFTSLTHAFINKQIPLRSLAWHQLSSNIPHTNPNYLRGSNVRKKIVLNCKDTWFIRFGADTLIYPVWYGYFGLSCLVRILWFRVIRQKCY